MPGMLLKLAPNERVLLNGLLIENGPKKTKMTVHSAGASVLRLRDAIHPADLGGPVSIAYYYAQLAVAGESDPADIREELTARLKDLKFAFEGTWAADPVAEAQSALEQQNFYKTMRSLSPLLPLERELMGGALQ